MKLENVLCVCVLLAMASSALGQVVCRDQLGRVVPCAVPVVGHGWYQGVRGVGDSTELMRWRMRAVRVTVGNVCGSGSLCGLDGEFAYILTNAHVAGTRIGRVCTLEFVGADSGVRKSEGEVVASGYSDRTLTDFALLRAPAVDFQGLQAIPLSVLEPSGADFVSWGCPRCEPITGVLLRAVDLGTPLKFSPDAIGGQSGSSIVRGGRQVGLLTWSWGGFTAAQSTASILRSVRSGEVSSVQRPEGLVEVVGNRSPVEVGIFKSAATIDTFPIWTDKSGDVPPPPATGGDGCKCCSPDCDCRKNAAGFDLGKFISVLELVLRLLKSLPAA